MRARGGRTGLDLDPRGAGGRQLLRACDEKRAADAMRLLDVGADRDAVNDGDYTPLILAAWHEELDGVAARLIAEGALPNAVNWAGFSALMETGWSGRAATARLLVQAGADLNLAGHDRRRGGDHVGRTALMNACMHNKHEIALMLIEAGARMDLVCINQKSALDYATDRGLAEVVAALRARGAPTGATVLGRRARAARAALPAAQAHALGEQLLAACKAKQADEALRLVGQGADVDVADAKGCTPLMVASHGLDAIAARLVAAGAAPDLVDSNGAPALLWACHEGHVGAARILLDAGAAIDLIALDGTTSLMHACSGGHSAAAALLVERGAALNIVNKGGLTSLDICDGKPALAAVAADMRARGGRTGAELDTDDRALSTTCAIV